LNTLLAWHALQAAWMCAPVKLNAVELLWLKVDGSQALVEWHAPQLVPN
jgi:hypothetical protein